MSGDVLLAALAVVMVPYYITRHPVKTYRLVVHNVGWYDPMYGYPIKTKE